MNTRELIFEIDLPARAERVFRILHTPSAIRAWWSADRALVIPSTGGIWAAAWGTDEDDPDYVSAASIDVFDPPRRLVLGRFRYLAKSGPLPFEADIETEFTVVPRSPGSVLRVRQSGFPVDREADDFYAACEQGWRDTLAAIRNYLMATEVAL